MKWTKLGRVFDPSNYKLPSNCFGFAQSPQVLVFDDFIRVYFSTRQRDTNGKYLSHVAFVEFDKNFGVIRVADSAVIQLGGLGCFDEHGIFPFNVLRAEGQVLAYTTGWNRRVSVSTDAAIGLAVSVDEGLTFKKVGDGPILGASLHEPFLIGDAFVRFVQGVYHMWYVFGTKWIQRELGEAPERVYKIGHAMSTDGVSWRKEGRQIIGDKLNADECQALPTVIDIAGRFHMLFCYRQATDFRHNRERGYRIGYAFSDDLVSWTRDDTKAGIDLAERGWDSDMQCYPHVFEVNGDVCMLYNGNEFGRYGFGLAILEGVGQ